MTNREKVEYICGQLSDDELLAALAEEAAEVAHASLKLRRAYNRSNPTPVSANAAGECLIDEMDDLMLCWKVFTRSAMGEEYPSYETMNTLNEFQQEKLDRWVQRLKVKHLKEAEENPVETANRDAYGGAENGWMERGETNEHHA